MFPILIAGDIWIYCNEYILWKLIVSIYKILAPLDWSTDVENFRVLIIIIL